MQVVVFPGQGSQFKGMGEALFKKFPDVVVRASDILGYDLAALCLDDPDNQLHLTQHTQPAIYVVNALSWLDHKSSFSHIDYLLGHSLGEYSALYAAGVFDFETGLELVKERGRLMSEANGGGMLAVLGMAAEGLQEFLGKHALSGVEIANYNTASQLVLSGRQDQIKEALYLLKEGNIQAIPLNVSAAFHSSYMQEAAKNFNQFLRGFNFNPLITPVIANVTARPYEASCVQVNLAQQISSSVLWDESIRYLMSLDKHFHFAELNERPVLTNMINSIQANEKPLELSDSRSVLASSESQVGKKCLGLDSTLKQGKENRREIKDCCETPSVSLINSQITVSPDMLGANSFRQRYGIKYAYLTGAMYRGVASKELVVAMGKAGLLGFLGTAGMHLDEVEEQIEFIQQQLGSECAYGMNLLCHLDNPEVEMKTVELFLKWRVTNIEAAAFMVMTPALVLYRLSGLYKDSHGNVECQHKIIAKVSRPEVAEAFLNPPPEKIVNALYEEGRISRAQMEMSSEIAMSSDICVEADSGGHTDQGVATALLPAIQSLRNEIQRENQYKQAIHIGLAGGIGTPQAIAAAFIMGADFVLTGSINQCTVEAGTSDSAKNLLQAMNIQDTDYAPAGDMFELGAKVQVLKKGVFFPARANKLFMLYSHYDGWYEIPEKIRSQIEARYFQKSYEDVWLEVRSYHQSKGRKGVLEKAEANEKHKMALIFRWYFSYSGALALKGDEENRVDFQIHTGPALGAFNQWVKGTELDSWRKRHVDKIAEMLMQEAAELLGIQYKKLINP